MLKTLFYRCDQLLTQYQQLWQLHPFSASQDTSLPLSLALSDGLAQLSLQDMTSLHPFESGLDWLARHTPANLILSLRALQTAIPEPAQANMLPETFKALSQGVPGRKWQQMQALVSLLPDSAIRNRPILEWCAGKGHLGRLLAVYHRCPVCSLEWQQELCDQGERLIHKQQQRYPQLQQSMLQADACSDTARQQIAQHSAVVALHACGDLHTNLIRSCQDLAVSDQAPDMIAISPCCYHLTRDEQYQPCSVAGRSSALRFSRFDLKIPLQETVTGGQRIERIRDQELLWRLSFDQLRQQLTGEPGYRPLPGFSRQLLSGSFTQFVFWALNNRGLTQQYRMSFTEADLKQALSQGEKRMLNVRRIEWLQGFFRAPLELWLVLDRALALEEAGFAVEVTRFCPRAMTPRNWLILAQKK